ncbi:adenine phosphoribosyltransferase, variant [Aphanomyces invadans]|uniref:adenine phosphoribosyltransferase n=1 Tax=Aphanomyces invadans TaxID=157072 RepID=A0A024U690_9STRA|nr:adenine phosphoribosyltransferase [Aphanomyces invadans]XP_008869643.1 adenine phosphoribosyltransferase, variant [Aphanomyces invadans]ETW01794.1 adenine phosphoribosyltransferase [Aphanomyces invadans]ETW01795.1 adenine phosphoribosyltransferase, variant [Aphanomyces invadans]RHY34169.1 hypothetical protein DYB32_004181 [Aphanomyces invadans]|eukprot:XP_008869642.1 adenine phosphoribosyltransferase [Aphanomyces invadans]
MDPAGNSMDQTHTDDERLRQVAACIPIVPFKGVSFYDIGGLLASPVDFAICMDLLVAHVEPFANRITSIGCFDARGFLLGPVIAMRLKKKLFMLRKPNKMPRVSHSVRYGKEYAGDDPNGGDDGLCIQEGAVVAGDQVLLIDDLLATGGTMAAGVDLVKQCGGQVLACGCLIELGVLQGRQRILSRHPGTTIFHLLSENLWAATS